MRHTRKVEEENRRKDIAHEHLIESVVITLTNDSDDSDDNYS